LSRRLENKENILPNEMSCMLFKNDAAGHQYSGIELMTPHSKKFQIKETKTIGKGVFASEKILKGQTIWILDGEIILYDDCVNRVETGKENIDDPLQIDEWLYIDLDELSRTFNHSCNPSAGLQKRSELFALRDIQIGEQITYDYSSAVWPNITPDIWTMKCLCNENKCRKTIGNILTIPSTELQRYYELGALQDSLINHLFKLNIIKTDGIHRSYLMPNHIEYSQFYTSLEEAKEEIWKRWRDMDLRRKVQDFIGNIPQQMQDAPKAVLDRNIATPNLEFFYFLELSSKTNLSPLVTEYISDKFVTNNVDKLALAKMPFFKGRNENRGGGKLCLPNGN
jgi:uncharacterized protein